MGRSSKPRRQYRRREADFTLLLTRGGGAELIDPETDDTVWSSDDDAEFQQQFPDFLHQSDVAKILEYLVNVDVLSDDEADWCEIREEFFQPSDLTGTFGDV